MANIRAQDARRSRLIPAARQRIARPTRTAVMSGTSQVAWKNGKAKSPSNLMVYVSPIGEGSCKKSDRHDPVEQNPQAVCDPENCHGVHMPVHAITVIGRRNIRRDRSTLPPTFLADRLSSIHRLTTSAAIHSSLLPTSILRKIPVNGSTSLRWLEIVVTVGIAPFCGWQWRRFAHNTFAVSESGTAGPSASLGMTKGRPALTSAAVTHDDGPRGRRLSAIFIPLTSIPRPVGAGGMASLRVAAHLWQWWRWMATVNQLESPHPPRLPTHALDRLPTKNLIWTSTTLSRPCRTQI